MGGARARQPQHGPSRAPLCPNRSQAATRDDHSRAPCDNRTPRPRWRRPTPRGRRHPQAGPDAAPGGPGLSRPAEQGTPVGAVIAPPVPGPRRRRPSVQPVAGLPREQFELGPRDQAHTAWSTTLRTDQHHGQPPLQGETNGPRGCGASGRFCRRPRSEHSGPSGPRSHGPTGPHRRAQRGGCQCGHGGAKRPLDGGRGTATRAGADRALGGSASDRRGTQKAVPT